MRNSRSRKESEKNAKIRITQMRIKTSKLHLQETPITLEVSQKPTNRWEHLPSKMSSKSHYFNLLYHNLRFKTMIVNLVVLNS